MSVLLIAGIGIAIVLISILLLRLHPLLALLIGSLSLLVLTPIDTRLENQLADDIFSVQSLSNDGLIGFDRLIAEGNYRLWRADGHPDDGRTVTLARSIPATADEFAWYDVSIKRDTLTESNAIDPSALQVQQDDLLVAVQRLESAKESTWAAIADQLVSGFAKTFRKLGIPVTMAAIVGVCLLESGAAARLVKAIISLFGPRGTAPALTFSGFVLGVPVYFDNVFYLLLPLAKAIGRTRPETFLSAVMAIIVGATMAHSLVPPTPGPLLVASEMGVSVGMMMIGGFVVGSIAASAGFAYGKICHMWVKLTPEQLPEPVEEDSSAGTKRVPIWLAAVPIALPILSLGGSEVLEFVAKDNAELSIPGWTALLNNPSLVFILTAVVSILILRVYTSRKVVSSSVARGIADAGTIVLLTCAGGSFGAALQQLGIAGEIGDRFSGEMSAWGMLVTAFLVTTIIRAAQGSATVAMITSVAIVAEVTQAVELPFHPLYVALAIGCGSKPLPWMNDSGFWQVSTMTGMTPGQTLRTFSVALTLMGITGFIVVLLGAKFLPLV